MFGALIIVILLSIWVTKESARIQSLLEEKNAPPQVAIPEQNILPDYIAQSPATYEKKSAITIIKPAPKEKPAPELTQQPEEIRPTATPTTSHASGSSATSGRETESGTDEPSSGITKIDNKHPSEIESKEMNQRGIVMW
jgi:hypothetical protein